MSNIPSHDERPKIPEFSRYDKAFAASLVIAVGSLIGVELRDILSKIPARSSAVAPREQSLAPQMEQSADDQRKATFISSASISDDEILQVEPELAPVVVSE